MAADQNPGRDFRSLKRATTAYQAPARGRSLGQVVTAFGPFVAICAAMYASPDLPTYARLALTVLAASFVVRIFIIQHDCGHGSFFRSPRANALVGVGCSLITLTPFASWRRQHAGHHANWNNLDRRHSGVDIYSGCLTVKEYRELTRLERARYRIIRHPVVALVLLPPLVFLFLYRLPFDMPKAWRRERRSVHLTNLALAAVVLSLGFTLGFQRVLMVQLPITIMAAIVGAWLFSLQHRFENTRWARRGAWTFADASLRGSSYLKLPQPLQWLTGNIGFHHVHHLNPRIPNYRLQECHDAEAALQTGPVLTLWDGLTAARYALWDEDRGRMVSFRAAQGSDAQASGAGLDRVGRGAANPSTGVSQQRAS